MAYGDLLIKHENQTKKKMKKFTLNVIKNDAGKVVNSKRHVYCRLGSQVVDIRSVMFVLFGQQRGIRASWKLSLLIHQGQNV